jgi:hypothetical protein
MTTIEITSANHGRNVVDAERRRHLDRIRARRTSAKEREAAVPFSDLAARQR